MWRQVDPALSLQDASQIEGGGDDIQEINQVTEPRKSGHPDKYVQ
jgi:hypothetical protein